MKKIIFLLVVISGAVGLALMNTTEPTSPVVEVEQEKIVALAACIVADTCHKRVARQIIGDEAVRSVSIETNGTNIVYLFTNTGRLGIFIDKDLFVEDIDLDGNIDRITKKLKGKPIAVHAVGDDDFSEYFHGAQKLYLIAMEKSVVLVPLQMRGEEKRKKGKEI